jgi:hypothetical protein
MHGVWADELLLSQERESTSFLENRGVSDAAK